MSIYQFSRFIPAFALFTLTAWAQVSVPSGPPPAQAISPRRAEAAPAQRSQLGAAPRVQLGNINDSLRDVPPPRAGLLRVATNRPIDVSQMAAGVWQQTTDGNSVWRLALRSNQAVGVRLHFVDFNAGQGQIWIHDASSQQVFGPYTGRGRNQDGDFWTEVVFADTVEIEYKPAVGSSTSGQPPFRISELAHLWQMGRVVAPRNPRAAQLGNEQFSRRSRRLGLDAPIEMAEPEASATAASTNYSCFLDATCYSSPSDQNYHPEVEDAIRSSAFLLFSDSTGSYQCSGTLLNAPNGNPILLTAGHCINNQDIARTTVAIFNAVDQSCVTDSTKFPAPSDAQLRALPQVNGVRLLSVSDQPFLDETNDYEVGNDLDYSLILMNQFPNWPDLLLSGYSSYGITSQVTSVSAPQGLFLKVSFGYPLSSLWSNGYDVDQTSLGRIDLGSSGSGLFDGEGHLLGVLSTGVDPCEGASTCTKTSCDWNQQYVATYTAFAAIYPSIRNYLNEPLDTPGTTLPYDPTVFSASPLGGIDAFGHGATLLTYDAPPSVTNVEIHVSAPNGALFYQGGQKGQVLTGPWATDGMTFYLQDVSQNQSRTLANTLATATAHSTPVTLTATPPFLLSTDGATFGMLTLNWDVPGAKATEVHLGSASGPLFAYSGQESGWAQPASG